jgi:hypothetical protein
VKREAIDKRLRVRTEAQRRVGIAPLVIRGADDCDIIFRRRSVGCFSKRDGGSVSIFKSRRHLSGTRIRACSGR